MAIWDKLRTELDRAGKVAQGAIDEGKLRLEVFRARQLVDRAAQSLGYAVYRSRTGKDHSAPPSVPRAFRSLPSGRLAESPVLPSRLAR